jgi:hypothetical protein
MDIDCNIMIDCFHDPISVKTENMQLVKSINSVLDFIDNNVDYLDERFDLDTVNDLRIALCHLNSISKRIKDEANFSKL